MPKSFAKLVPVNERALVARINRALAKDERCLRKTREDSRWHQEMGDYATIDLGGNFVINKHVDLASFGRELGVFKEYERLAKD